MRYKPVSPKQLALQGVDLGIEWRPKMRYPQGGGKVWRASVKSLPGELVPLPKDRLGQELRLGPLAVLQDVWGRHFVMDYRRGLGEGEIFTGSKRACVVRMVELHTPLSPSPRT
jgi:hypothetical protein